MAVVAFPFASCITSDDVDEDLYGSFGINQQGSEETSLSEMEENDNDDKNDDDNRISDGTVSSAATPTSITSVPSTSPVEEEEEKDDSMQQSPAQEEEEEDNDMQKFPTQEGEENDDDMPQSPAEKEEEKDDDKQLSPAEEETEKDDDMQLIDDSFFQHLNQDEPENDEDASMAVEPVTRACSEKPTTFGGAYNMGNTCYLNSAVQMLNSLDHFCQELKQTPVPEQDASDDDVANKTLRDALLEVTEALNRGETVRPDAFKRVLDERTPLFVGFRQQDAHELLSTLLDLLDEDYKRKPEKADEDKDGEEKPESLTSEETKPGTADEAMSQAKSSSDEDPQHENDSPECYESAAKKPRNQLNFAGEQPAPLGARCQSFSELQPEGIEELLHGAPSATKLSEVYTTATSPRCKLVGGRMAAPDSGYSLAFDNNDISTTVVAEACDDMEEDTVASSVSSPIDSYFRTEVCVRLTCKSCSYSRCHTENFLHLSLEIGSNSGSVVDGLRRFFAPEDREVKCEKCFCESARQTMEITRLPRALLLHFKRFIVDVSPDYTSITYRKNQSEVDFDDKLLLDEEKDDVLGEFLAKDVSIPERLEDEEAQCYQIRSVVNHMGSSANCGHYTADALRRYPDGNRVWTRFNDSYVSPISAEEAIVNSSQTAYMVMYELS